MQRSIEELRTNRSGEYCQRAATIVAMIRRSYVEYRISKFHRRIVVAHLCSQTARVDLGAYQVERLC